MANPSLYHGTTGSDKLSRDSNSPASHPHEPRYGLTHVMRFRHRGGPSRCQVFVRRCADRGKNTPTDCMRPTSVKEAYCSFTHSVVVAPRPTSVKGAYCSFTHSRVVAPLELARGLADSLSEAERTLNLGGIWKGVFVVFSLFLFCMFLMRKNWADFTAIQDGEAWAVNHSMSFFLSFFMFAPTIYELRLEHSRETLSCSMIL